MDDSFTADWAFSLIQVRQMSLPLPDAQVF